MTTTGNIRLIASDESLETTLSADRRKSKRFKVSDLSNLILDINGRTITCKILDISESGAKIETSVLDLPSCFVLDAPTQNIRVLCKRVWTDKNHTGVQFLKTQAL